MEADMGIIVFQKEIQNSKLIIILLPVITGIMCVVLLIAGLTVSRRTVNAASKGGVVYKLLRDQPDQAPANLDSDPVQADVSLEAASANVEFIRQLGGDVSAVAIQGNIAYIGIGPELAAFELHNPGNPGWVGGVVFTADVEAVSISGTLAYVAAGEAGLRVVDISNPALLNEVGSIEIGINAIDVAIEGNYAYIADRSRTRLNVVDITNPNSPVVTGSYDLVSEKPNKLVVWKNFAYLATSHTLRTGGGVVIVDVSNPVAPQLEGSYDTPGDGVDLMVREEGSMVYAFIADNPGSLQVLDVTNPDSPTQKSAYDLRGSTSVLFIDGSVLYITDFGNNYTYGYFNDLLVLDISNLSNITLKSTYEFPMPISNPEPAVDMTTASGYLYLAMSEHSFQIMDISNPNQLKQTGVFETFYQANGIAIAGDTAYIADVRGLKLVNIQNPLSAHVSAFVGTPGYAEGVAVQGSYVYIADRSEGMRIIDVHEPGSPIEVGGFKDGYENVRSVDAAGNYAYLADWQGMVVVNISDPQNPYQVSLFATSSNAMDTTIDGMYAYIAQDAGVTNGGGMLVVNVLDPAHPTEAGFHESLDGRQAVKVVVRDDLAYLVSSVVEIINISEPTDPQLVGTYTPPYGIPADIALEGDYAFVAVRGDWPDLPGHLRVLDLADPANPVEVGYYDLPMDWPVAIAVLDGVIYITNVTGVFVYQFSSSTISGFVVDVHNKPIENVDIGVSAGFSTTTSVDGSYTTPGLPSGTYIITPSLTGFVFSPPSRTVALPPAAVNQDFTILSPPVETTLEPLASSHLTYTDTQGLPTTLFFPAGTVTITTDVVLNPLGRLSAPSGKAFAGHAFDLLASRSGIALASLKFLTPVSATINYNLADVEVISDTKGVSLWWWEAGEWQMAAQSCVIPGEVAHNLAGRIISTPICTTGRYALFGPTHQAYLPIVGNGKDSY
jgi:hypothetical protein